MLRVISHRSYSCRPMLIQTFNAGVGERTREEMISLMDETFKVGMKNDFLHIVQRRSML